MLFTIPHGIPAIRAQKSRRRDLSYPEARNSWYENWILRGIDDDEGGGVREVDDSDCMLIASMPLRIPAVGNF